MIQPVCTNLKRGQGRPLCDHSDKCNIHCVDGKTECEHYTPPTAEEIAQAEAESQRRSDLINRGLSPCCEAELDTRLVFTEGRYKGHGPRYCSKCRQLVYVV